MKIIYVTPHLSTGGMPEYLRRKVELMSEENDVWVVEKNFEPAYRSIRDKIEKIIGERLINIDVNQEKLLSIIEEVNPDIIHFEELSEYHFSDFVLEKIYSSDREYKIFDTLHDSSIDSKEKRFLPDKMIVVSPWQMKNFLDLEIPIEIIEHEIIPGKRDRAAGMKLLGLNPEKTHVLQVGLFSNRKNQKETFQLARIMPDIVFHFVGNQTDNYRDYWAPLMAEMPSNCVIWGERSDTDTFYSCVDCVIFPSRGNYGDRETSPLVIREAAAWGVPIFLRDLPVYMGMYSESKTVKFMSENLLANTGLLYEFLDKKNKKNMELSNDFFKGKLFSIAFDENENKINFEYLEYPRLDLKVCIRDIDTEVPIYAFDAAFEDKNTIWCIPIPKRYYDFQNNPNFGGFLYDFYMGGKRVYTMATRIKPSIVKKDRFRIESFEPLFINYEQFFTDKIYSGFLSQIDQLESVIDIGSNVGLFTELALKNGAKKVKCYEINDSAIEVFESLHGENKKVELVKSAVSFEPGEMKIFINKENSLISSLHPNQNMTEKTVDCISIDECVDKKLDLIKIDVEGSEYDIFRGASIETLQKTRFMLVEFHENFGGILRNEILEKLEKSGFEYKIYQGDCINDASEWEESGTIFAKNKNK